ncbi:MAG: 1-(5-phosphoribosyl)-5-[Clostridia bacterium]|nr:1-(5-phosphoribosyl)-5-[(5-phosphoribosylamino)methylideneamino]imidazole-4-carboxamide isomerase [Clostridia bacterium]
MNIFPAIDLYGGNAVRLFKGDYTQMTVYNEDPVAVARDFVQSGARHIHLVDLQGAKDGTTPHLDLICRLKKETGLFCEVGGGIRTMDTIERYVSAGIDRVILGTAAVTENGFVEQAVAKFGDAVAVGVDIRDGQVAIKGWTESADWEAFAFCKHMEQVGVRTLICTDISKDGAMQGANAELYRRLSEEVSLNIVASGGVSSMEDIYRLKALGLYGAIIGKAYYTGAIDLKEAIEVAV